MLNLLCWQIKGGVMDQMLLDVKIMKIHRLPEGKVKAFVDICVNDALIIKGLRVVDGKEGMFVAMPSEQGKDERWYERVRCLNKEIKTLVEQTVLEGYQSQESY
jgi:stage V sporulation protein G